MTSLIKDISIQVELGISSELGFRRIEPGILTRSETPLVLAWLGLNQGKRGACIEINPVVGVRNQEVEHVISDLLSEPRSEHVPPSISANIGYLSSARRYKCYLFDGARDNFVANMDLMVQDIRGVGYPFIVAMTNIACLIENLQSPRFHTGQAIYRVLVGLCLLNRKEEAELQIAVTAAKLDSRTDEAAKRMIRFIIALGRRFDLRVYLQSSMM
ncbi:MAG: hypothetical protein HC927_05035 [Deltaproteobacteria bacterium]|nr:hypothetical protein [Deltaproteobacteria bacterium]